MGWGMDARILNLEWLESNLGLEWSSEEETERQRVWLQKETWLMQSYPIQAFLLLLRDYMFGMSAEAEDRLRLLIPVLSRLGDAGFTLSALLLLGVFIMEKQGPTDVVNTILEQVSPELAGTKQTLSHDVPQEQVLGNTQAADTTQSAGGATAHRAGTTQFMTKDVVKDLEHALYQYLLGQIAVKESNLDVATYHYEALISIPDGTNVVLNFLLGRIYQKIGIFVLRADGHPLAAKWKFTADRWCSRHPSSPLVKPLQRLLAGNDRQLDLIHPLWAWRAVCMDSLSEVSIDAVSLGIQHMRELDVIWEITNARVTRSLRAAQKAVFLAETYADAFWLHAANCCLTVVDVQPQATQLIAVRDVTVEPMLRFTFFDTFQGYTATNEVLLPPTYNRHKVRQLLAILLMQPQSRIVRDRLMMHLFGNEYGESEGNYLHVTLHRLRQLLKRQTGVGGDWVAVRKDMILLNEQRISSVDIEEYRKLAAVGHELWPADEEAACDLYTKAVKMYHPVVAPEFEYEDWIAETRIFLEQQQRRMLKRLRQAANRDGRIDEAVRRGEELLALDPFDLTVLRELCDDWLQVGDTKTLRQACERAAQMLCEDGDSVPDWLVTLAGNGYQGIHGVAPSRRGVSLDGSK